MKYFIMIVLFALSVMAQDDTIKINHETVKGPYRYTTRLAVHSISDTGVTYTRFGRLHHAVWDTFAWYLYLPMDSMSYILRVPNAVSDTVFYGGYNLLKSYKHYNSVNPTWQETYFDGTTYYDTIFLKLTIKIRGVLWDSFSVKIPNPVNHVTSVEINSSPKAAAKGTARIYNISGQCIGKADEVGAWRPNRPGIYFARYKSGLSVKLVRM